MWVLWSLGQVPTSPVSRNRCSPKLFSVVMLNHEHKTDEAGYECLKCPCSSRTVVSCRPLQWALRYLLSEVRVRKQEECCPFIWELWAAMLMLPAYEIGMGWEVLGHSAFTGVTSHSHLLCFPFSLRLKWHQTPG